MRQFTITVPEDRLRRIQKLLRQEPGVTVSRSRVVEAPETPKKKKLTRQQQEWVDDLKQSLVDVERHQRGEIELQSFDEFMKEMDAEHEAHWGKGGSK
ncbi:MAG: hypothetical protein H7330_10385 [Hymenobacteraceae bacterium]|nr:hypothetical protein [Hymenobacteraceae bacterium]